MHDEETDELIGVSSETELLLLGPLLTALLNIIKYVFKAIQVQRAIRCLSSLPFLNPA